MNGGLPCAIVVMGASGCGKSTIGAALAHDFDATFLEGDRFHPPANVAKMSAGIPLDDEDRGPWLDRIGRAAGEVARDAGLVVIACSALKLAYRDRLRAAANVPVRIVCLVGSRPVIEDRLRTRTGHFMPASLLETQLSILEPPGAAEDALILDAALAPDALVAAVRTWIRMTGGAARLGDRAAG